MWSENLPDLLPKDILEPWKTSLRIFLRKEVHGLKDEPENGTYR